MKVIFLDVDGVLNSRRYDACRRAEEPNVDESRLPLLRELIGRTQAKLVLSSSWRSHWDAAGPWDAAGRELSEALARHGLTLWDRTPDLGGDRAEEIRFWLKEHPETERFVILDDGKFGWGELGEHTVLTDYRVGRGLEAEHIRRAAELLL